MPKSTTAAPAVTEAVPAADAPDVRSEAAAALQSLLAALDSPADAEGLMPQVYAAMEATTRLLPPSADLSGWDLLRSDVPDVALKPMGREAGLGDGMSDINDAYLLERLINSGLPWRLRGHHLDSEGKTVITDLPEIDVPPVGPGPVHAACRMLLEIDGQQYAGWGAHQAKKWEWAVKGAKTSAFKDAARWAGMTLSVYKRGRIKDDQPMDGGDQGGNGRGAASQAEQRPGETRAQATLRQHREAEAAKEPPKPQEPAHRQQSPGTVQLPPPLATKVCPDCGGEAKLRQMPDGRRIWGCTNREKKGDKWMGCLYTTRLSDEIALMQDKVMEAIRDRELPWEHVGRAAQEIGLPQVASPDDLYSLDGEQLEQFVEALQGQPVERPQGAPEPF